MRSVIILFPGTNRSRDMTMAIRRVSPHAPRLVRHHETDLPSTDLIVLPGGFAYGDYLRAGAMAARAPVMRAVVEQARRGVMVLGVCNGFQVLTEVGLLPGALMRNAGLAFTCRTVALDVATTSSPFTAGYGAMRTITLPVANNDGNFHADEETLDRLEGEDLVALRYADPTLSNGSARRIAGILNPERTVLGLMPHPENAIDSETGGEDGLVLFRSLAGLFR